MNLKNKTDAELMAEIDALIENVAAEDIDVEAIKRRLAILNERDPETAAFDPQTGWERICRRYGHMLGLTEDGSKM